MIVKKMMNKQSEDMILSVDKLIKVERFEYPRWYITKCLKNNDLNYSTNTFKLLN